MQQLLSSDTLSNINDFVQTNKKTIIGSVAVCGAVATLLFFWRRRKAQAKQEEQYNKKQQQHEIAGANLDDAIAEATISGFNEDDGRLFAQWSLESEGLFNSGKFKEASEIGQRMRSLVSGKNYLRAEVTACVFAANCEIKLQHFSRAFTIADQALQLIAYKKGKIKPPKQVYSQPPEGQLLDEIEKQAIAAYVLQLKGNIFSEMAQIRNDSELAHSDYTSAIGFYRESLNLCVDKDFRVPPWKFIELSDLDSLFAALFSIRDSRAIADLVESCFDRFTFNGKLASEEVDEEFAELLRQQNTRLTKKVKKNSS